MSTLPGPSGPLLRLRTSARVLRDPVAFYRDGLARYGPIWRTKGVNGDLVVVGTAELAREVFALPPDTTGPFGVEALRGLLGPGSLFLMGGARHQRERRLLTPAFHGDRMEAFGGAIREVIARVTSGWGDGQEIVAVDELVAITFEIIVRVVFGIDDPALVGRFLDLVRQMVDAAHPLLLFMPWTQIAPFGLGPYARLRRLREQVDGLLVGEIRRRRATGERGSDVLSLLVDATYEDGAPISDQDLCDELVTLMFAGHETTSVAVAWSLYELAGTPELTRAAVAELDASPELEKVARLPFLDAVWQETLRLHPPLPDVLRTLLKPVTIGGHPIAAGESLVVPVCLLHLDEAVFPEAEAFRPARWLDGKPPAFQVLPFGGGNRRCIGAALATFEAQIVLATLLGTFVFERTREERVVRRNATMGPEHGVRLRVHRAQDASAIPDAPTASATRGPPEWRRLAPRCGRFLAG